MKERRAWLVLLLTVCALTFVSISWAQALPPSKAGPDEEVGKDTSPRTAVQYGHLGLGLFSEKKWGRAAAAFEKAEALAHSPVFLLYAARSWREQGRLLKAHRLYRSCVTEPLTENSPNPWVEAVHHASEELEQLARGLSSVRLRFSGPWTMPLRLWLPTGELDVHSSTLEVTMTPGEYLIRAEDARGHVAEQIWTAKAGAHRVEIQIFARLPSDAPTSAQRPATPSDWTIHSEEPRATRRGAAVAFGAAGVALLSGVIGGGMAISYATRLKKGCVDGICDPADEHLKYKALTSARLATVGFVVAAAGGALGLSLWLIPPAENGGGALKAAIYPNGAQLSGSF